MLRNNQYRERVLKQLKYIHDMMDKIKAENLSDIIREKDAPDIIPFKKANDYIDRLLYLARVARGHLKIVQSLRATPKEAEELIYGHLDESLREFKQKELLEYRKQMELVNYYETSFSDMVDKFEWFATHVIIHDSFRGDIEKPKLMLQEHSYLSPL